MNKKKVCFIISTFHSGGTENYLLRFLKFSKDSFDVTLICKNENCYEGVLKKEYDKLGISIICQPLGYLNIRKLRNFFLILKKGRFDTICDLSGNFGGIPILFAKVLHVPNRVVFYRRSSLAFEPTRFKLAYNYFVNKLVFWYANKIFSNSKHAFDFFFSNKYQTDNRFKVIYNGLNLKDFDLEISKNSIRRKLGIKKGVYLIGHIGRYNYAKNHITIFEVAKRLIKMDAQIEFLFCGMGTNTEKFRNQISHFGISENVHLLGERSDVFLILKALDLFYFPSTTEGQPNALIEAMLTNLPIVTSKIPAIKEIIPNDMHQQLLDPLEVECHVKLIEQIKMNSKDQIDYKLKDWAINKFNSETNFKVFKKEL